MSSATAEAHHDDHGHSHELSWPQQLRANRMGLWLFCISEIFSVCWRCWRHVFTCGVANDRS